MEGLCLASKKLELCRDRVSFFGAIYSREGVEPDPKKIQGIEMSARDQAAAPVVPGHGDIHGKHHTPSKPSHRAAETAAEERCHILLG